MGAALLVLLGSLVPSIPVRAQAVGDEQDTSLKASTTLLPPSGATNGRAKGSAKTFYVENENQIVQRLQVSAQRLERGQQYRLTIDGVDFGVYSPRGGSGTLALRFRDPAKGNLLPFPLGVEVDVRLFSVIQLVNDATGEIVLEGQFS